MATDFNITMKQYNGVDYDTLYPETKGSQIITPVPIASGGTNSNTASGAMNNLITALSTIIPANNDLIPFKDSSGNTVGKATISSLASVLQSVGGYAKIQTGSYVGTGTYGSSNPCSLTFDFVPKMIMMVGYYNGSEYFSILSGGNSYTSPRQFISVDALSTSYKNGTGFGSPANASVYGKISQDGKTFTWYSTESALRQANLSNYKYYWFVI